MRFAGGTEQFADGTMQFKRGTEQSVDDSIPFTRGTEQLAGGTEHFPGSIERFIGGTKVFATDFLVSMSGGGGRSGQGDPLDMWCCVYITPPEVDIVAVSPSIPETRYQ